MIGRQMTFVLLILHSRLVPAKSLSSNILVHVSCMASAVRRVGLKSFGADPP